MLFCGVRHTYYTRHTGHTRYGARCGHYLCRLLAVIVLLLCVGAVSSRAQDSVIDSLRGVIAAKDFMAQHDTTRAAMYIGLAYQFSQWSKYDQTFLYCDSALNLASRTGDATIKANALNLIGMTHVFSARYEPGFRSLFDALEIAEAKNVSKLRSAILHNISVGFFQVRHYHKALEYMRRTLALNEQMLAQMRQQSSQASSQRTAADPATKAQLALLLQGVSYANGWLAYIHGTLGNLDSARIYIAREQEIDTQRTFQSATDKAYNDINISSTLAAVYAMNAQMDSAKKYAVEALQQSALAPDPYSLTLANKALGEVYLARGDYAKAEQHLLASVTQAHQANVPQVLVDIYHALMKLKRTQAQTDQALEY